MTTGNRWMVSGPSCVTPAGYSLAQVVVAGAGREHVDAPATVSQARRDLTEHQFGPPDHVGAVAGRHEGEATGLHGGPTLLAVPVHPGAALL